MSLWNCVISSRPWWEFIWYGYMVPCHVWLETWRNIVVVWSYIANMVVVVFHVLQGKSFFMENLTLASGRRTHISAPSLANYNIRTVTSIVRWILLEKNMFWEATNCSIWCKAGITSYYFRRTRIVVVYVMFLVTTTLFSNLS